MKVLIVDDSPINLKLLRAILEAENAEVVEAADGLEALAALELGGIDAIISDILMPRMDGYRLCHEVRKHARWRTMPFLFHTATYTSTDDEKLCRDLGADKYLKKPASAELIWSSLRDVMASDRRPAKESKTPSESDVMREYSERLVAKLEARNADLEQTRRRLEQANRELEKGNRELDLRVRQRTMELEVSTLELEAFSYSVSHDLRAPLRHIEGFASMVLRDGAAQLDATNLRHLHIICESTHRMAALIDALLEMSKLSHAPLRRGPVDLSELAREVAAEVRQGQPDRAARIEVLPDLKVEGDRNLLRDVLMNLLGNAWKFTSKRPDALIEFGRDDAALESPFYVHDNGAGFDMAHANKLFKAFQRLHGQEEFEGTGIGLATVQRIVQKHGGRIWAESAPGKGATFYFTLGEAGS
jgi:signal transduction histidine kinase